LFPSGSISAPAGAGGVAAALRSLSTARRLDSASCAAWLIEVSMSFAALCTCCCILRSSSSSISRLMSAFTSFT
jgi:hypothetical protein